MTGQLPRGWKFLERYLGVSAGTSKRVEARGAAAWYLFPRPLSLGAPDSGGTTLVLGIGSNLFYSVCVV